ncbi:O-succinylbenzoic acid--CoA ligase [Litorihabitans aurantiacus]|uniref:O-succinylbenzoic acid--CoA ligase n=1 Tax=Litorihabitans aurantiacus TaxID=1930061 RepID=A0AA37XFM6_9MICO|nr:O-succinylbenzoic acid--CoA ligase [Litorihabitans aurantiacus]
MRASATATHAALGGPLGWLLTLPAGHVAGVMVAARAHLGGTPLTHATPGPFRPATFADDVARHRAALADAGVTRSATSLVPTQLRRVLADPRAREAAATFDVVLVGGAATPPALADEARAAGVRVVTTYGMTETSGGCVYDGVPLPGVRVRITGDGLVALAGPQLALGYLTPDGFEAFDGELVTADRGILVSTAGGTRLRVLGRADDVVVTGGVNVDPAQVEAALTGVAGVEQACVVGLPEPEWGAVVAAALVLGPAPARDTDAVVATAQESVRATLGGAWVPRRVVVVDALPLRGPGKVDRRAVRDLLTGR